MISILCFFAETDLYICLECLNMLDCYATLLHIHMYIFLHVHLACLSRGIRVSRWMHTYRKKAKICENENPIEKVFAKILSLRIVVTNLIIWTKKTTFNFFCKFCWMVSIEIGLFFLLLRLACFEKRSSAVSARSPLPSLCQTRPSLLLCRPPCAFVSSSAEFFAALFLHRMQESK
jgi:hypothetical protein